jgi:BssS protein family
MDQQQPPNEAAFPVARATIGPVPAHGVVLIRFDFLTNALQSPDQANAGRNYVLTPVQARHVAEQILSALATLENAPSSRPPGPQH